MELLIVSAVCGIVGGIGGYLWGFKSLWFTVPFAIVFGGLMGYLLK